MNLSINAYSKVPVYHQIQNQICCVAASGEMKPGERLPSVRELAGEFAVNANTVAKAYRDLELMGVVFTRRGMGVYITKDAPKICRRKLKRQFIESIYYTSQDAKKAGLSKTELTKMMDACWAAHVGRNGEVPKKLFKLAD